MYPPPTLQEQAEKLASAQAYNAKMNINTADLQGSCGTSEPMQEMLSQRFRTKLNRSKRENYRTHQIEELVHLLEKNPEVARILDLIDAIGGNY